MADTMPLPLVVLDHEGRLCSPLPKSRHRKQRGNGRAVCRAPVVEQGPQHVWAKEPGWAWEACRVCGVVRRADDRNLPCRGPVKLSLREAEV